MAECGCGTLGPDLCRFFEAKSGLGHEREIDTLCRFGIGTFCFPSTTGVCSPSFEIQQVAHTRFLDEKMEMFNRAVCFIRRAEF